MLARLVRHANLPAASVSSMWYSPTTNKLVIRLHDDIGPSIIAELKPDLGNLLAVVGIDSMPLLSVNTLTMLPCTAGPVQSCGGDSWRIRMRTG